jgi:glycine/D-amino acid oxidase-like deaminating enzyme
MLADRGLPTDRLKGSEALPESGSANCRAQASTGAGGAQFNVPLVTSLVTHLHGRGALVVLVETTGGRMSADCYVLALGSYSPQLARRLGYRLPVYPVKGYSMTFPIPNVAHAPAIGGVDEAHLLAWARFGTRLRITAGAEFAGYNSRFAPGDFGPMLRAVRELFPHSADYSQPTYWAGLRPMTPEGTPYIGRTRHTTFSLTLAMGIWAGPGRAGQLDYWRILCTVAYQRLTLLGLRSLPRMRKELVFTAVRGDELLHSQRQLRASPVSEVRSGARDR